jgi:hypothetical protein
MSASACDLRTIDLLARLQLVARRHGHELRLAHASTELGELITLVGLDAVLCLEPRRQPEEGENPVGIEEEGQLDDPAV